MNLIPDGFVLNLSILDSTPAAGAGSPDEDLKVKELESHPLRVGLETTNIECSVEAEGLIGR